MEVTYPDDESDTYTYDDVGNRLTKDTDDYTYDAANQLTDLEGVEYDYDDNGNQIARGNDTFSYDHENRLVESVIDSVTSSSTYNGDGLRVSHTVGQTTTGSIWDVAAGLPVVLQEGANTYVYGLGLVSKTDSQDNQLYYLSDGLGSTTTLTDGQGNVVGTYGYDVFGAIRSESGGQANDFKFAGQQLDEASGLYYLRARYYDPAIGRFLTRDPFRGSLGSPQSQNPYAYVMNNPANLTDPAGLCVCMFGRCLPCPPPVECALDLPDCIKRTAESVNACIHDPFGCLVQTAINIGLGLLPRPYVLTPSIENLVRASSWGDEVPKEGGILLIKNCQGLCRVFLDVVGQSAFTVGHTIFAKSEPSDTLLQHELNHVDQYEALGDWFLFTYLSNQVLLIPVCRENVSCYENKNFWERQAGPVP